MKNILVFSFIITMHWMVFAGEPETTDPLAACKSLTDCKLNCPEGATLQTADVRVFCEKDGQPNGYGVIFGENGNMAAFLEFKDGKAHGKVISFYESGAKQAELDYKDGWPHGNGIMWYETGEKWREGVYRFGRMCGNWSAWDKEGKPIEFMDPKAKEDHCQPSPTGTQCPPCKN